MYLYIVPHVQCIAQCPLFTIDYEEKMLTTLSTVNYTFNTDDYSLCSVKCTLLCTHWLSECQSITAHDCVAAPVQTVNCTLFIVHFTLYTVHCLPYTFLWYTVHRILYTVHCTPDMQFDTNFKWIKCQNIFLPKKNV